MPTTQTLIDGRTRDQFSTKETAQCIRAALKSAFPGVKFSVTTSYASMTSSTRIQWTDGPTEPEVERVTGRFTSRGFDGMTDCTTYHSQIVDGCEVQYSGWVTTRREVSAALLNKAVARYQIERTRFGAEPARLHVDQHASGGAYLAGPDLNQPNPCGGRAVWVQDAVYQIAYTMRPNGCCITVKESR